MTCLLSSATKKKKKEEMADEGKGAKKRKLNWTKDECLYLYRPMEETKEIIRAKFSMGVTTL